ncbi:hypothetical protein CD241_0537 [Corynebacterium diphtheriae 241]|nr:hypothetical protein CD241_0537 [Corynebacterium diphtheriae 241]
MGTVARFGLARGGRAARSWGWFSFVSRSKQAGHMRKA